MATQESRKPCLSTGLEISWKNMLLLALVNMFSWTKAVSSTTILKCASSSLDLDTTLDLLVLMLPIKMLQWNAAIWWLPMPFGPSCWAQSFL